MHTIVVPVDFSDTSVNASRYAAAFASVNKSVGTVVLYHSFIAEKLSSGRDGIALMAAAEEAMQELKTTLLQTAREIQIRTVVNDGYVYENIAQLVEETNALCIVMGITGKNKIEQKLIGSNTVHVARRAPCPVLIVPPAAVFRTIDTAGLALPLKEGLEQLIPATAIKSFLQTIDAGLIVINVESPHTDNQEEAYAGVSSAHAMFDDIRAGYKLLTDTDVAKGIADFAVDQQLPLIISVAEEHGFLEMIFKGSITEKLAFYTTVPLLVFKAS